MRNYANYLIDSKRNTEALSVLSEIKKINGDSNAQGQVENIINEASNIAQEADISFRDSDPKKAISLYLEAIEKLPKFIKNEDVDRKRYRWLDNLGMLYILDNNFDDAYLSFISSNKILDRLVKKHPNEEPILAAYNSIFGKMGWIEAQNGNRNSSLSLFLEAVRIAELRLKRFPSENSAVRALDAYEKALTLLKNNWSELKEKVPLVLE